MMCSCVASLFLQKFYTEKSKIKKETKTKNKTPKKTPAGPISEWAWGGLSQHNTCPSSRKWETSLVALGMHCPIAWTNRRSPIVRCFGFLSCKMKLIFIPFASQKPDRLPHKMHSIHRHAYQETELSLWVFVALNHSAPWAWNFFPEDKNKS